jgi:CSLREA domain-containing protein
MSAAVREFVLRSRPPLAVVAVLAWLAVAAPAAATQIVVTTTEDEMTNDGDCSLREAFRAANTNVVRDACPAGSSASSDTIVLAADAVYSRTIPPSGTNDGGATGALVVLSNPATIDLQITVAGGGVATISQDAVPDDRVLVVGNGVSVGIDGVTIENGTLTAAAARGAGILTGSGSRLVLSNCGIRHNRSLDSGGGIRSGGELIVQDSSFDSNFTSG